MGTAEQERAVNRYDYQDTVFESIPHIELGHRVRNDRLAGAIEQAADRAEARPVGWPGDNRSGRLVALGRELRDEIEQDDAGGELETAHTHAVVWRAPADRYSEDETTVHLLAEHEAETIGSASLTDLLERVAAYYTGPRRAALRPDDPLGELVDRLATAPGNRNGAA